MPVIISSVPYAAKYIHEYKAGFIVDNTPEDVFRVANVVYNNPSMLGLLRQEVHKLYEKFNADIVLDQAFRAMLNHSHNEKDNTI